MNEHTLSTAPARGENSKTGPRRRRRNAAQWQALIDQQQSGGLSVRAFCQREGLNKTSCYAWRRRLGAPAEASPEMHRVGPAESRSFIRLEPSSHVGSDPDTIEVRFACGAILCCASDRLVELVRLLTDGHGEAGPC